MSKRFTQPLIRALSWGMVGYGGGGGNLSLNSAFTFNSAGASMGYRFVAPVTSTLTDFYFYVAAFTGTPGTVTVEVRNVGASGIVPGTTILATQSVTMDTTAARWNKCTFATPASLTQNTEYWVIIYNTTATPASNFPALMAYSSHTQPEGNANQTQGGMFRPYSTTTGWTATNNLGSPICVMKFGDGSVLGNGYSQTKTNYTSNTLERGLKFTLPFDAKLAGVAIGGGATISGLKIYKGTTAPGGTTIFSATLAPNAGFAWTNDLLLVRNQLYRAVCTFSANGTGPQYNPMLDYSRFADVQATVFGDGYMSDTIDNGAGGWTDNADRMPQVSLVFSQILSGGNSWST